ERSYGIYLWHWPVLMFSRPGIDVHLARGLLIPAQAVVTVAIAAASYRFVEGPIRNGTLLQREWLLFRSLRRPAYVLVATSIGTLALLIALTPEGASALPPGFDHATLARSSYTATHLVELPRAAPPAHTSTRHHTLHRVRVKPPAPPIPQTGPILAVGDSVLLGSSAALRSALGPELRIDAVVARQATDTIDRLYAYRAEGPLPKRMIVHIGDNGPIYSTDLHRLRQVLAGVPLVVLVNVRVGRAWQGEVNEELASEVKGWKQATVADWLDQSAAPGYVVGDGTHTTPAGAQQFAALLSRAIHHPVLGGVTH
ncbi:MAG: hypothetical protein ABI317_15870, partial [Gaiellales bacterium]